MRANFPKRNNSNSSPANRRGTRRRSRVRHQPRRRLSGYDTCIPPFLAALVVIFTALSRVHESDSAPVLTFTAGASNAVASLDGREVHVYVYDAPAYNNDDLIECYLERHHGVPPWQDEHHDMVQDMGEIWLHRAMLEHPWRVLDPAEADVFFIPMYPVLSYKLLGAKEKCRGRTHRKRITQAIEHLRLKSPYFNRFGGADHFIPCVWWSCGRTALDRWHRMVLRRTVVGINEPKGGWVRWGCPGKMLVVPYTASSVLTEGDMLGGRPEVKERNVPFFFVGTGRHRPERQNLEVVRAISPESVILLGGDQRVWDMDAPKYAEVMSRSRFCFCPRGDTPSSRRIFDAVAAGCIPVITPYEQSVLPYQSTGLNYTNFVVIGEEDSFSSHQGVTALVHSILQRPEEELEALRPRKANGALSILYGTTAGPTIEDMHPFQDTATRVLLEMYRNHTSTGEGMWGCSAVNLTLKQLAPRTWSSFPLPQNRRRAFRDVSETIVNMEHSLLLCAPPNTGSLQYRMLAKRMQGIEHWAVSDNRALLFDPKSSELPLLDLDKNGLMARIYKENGSGWIKIGVVRDPVTRVLSAYLDLIHEWGRGESRSQPEQEGEEEENVSSTEGTPDADIGEYIGEHDDYQETEAENDEDHHEENEEKHDGESHQGVDNGGRRSLRQGATPSSLAQETAASKAAAEGDMEEARFAGVDGEYHDTSHSVRSERSPHLLTRSQSSERTSRRLETATASPAPGQHRERVHVDGQGARHRHRVGERHGEEGVAEAEAAEAVNRRDLGGIIIGDEDVEVGLQGRHRRATVVETFGKAGRWWKEGKSGADPPSFAAVLEALSSHGVSGAPLAFREMSGQCGMWSSPFDSYIPYETLQDTSAKVLKSLPGGIWDKYGESGWGPEGQHSFMEFDYGKPYQDSGDSPSDTSPSSGKVTPRRTRDLFADGSCAWTEYYVDERVLDIVKVLYSSDYKLYAWYEIGHWKERMRECFKDRQ